MLENALVGAQAVSRAAFLRHLVWLPSARRNEHRALAQASRYVFETRSLPYSRSGSELLAGQRVITAGLDIE